MSKVYIIPGFRHEISDDEYTWLIDHVKNIGHDPISIKISWNNRVMSDYVSEFLSQYEYRQDNIVIGFSFGAMIAAVSAPKTSPDQLFLLSLSPYFSRDISGLKKAWLRNIGPRRADDFMNYDFDDISKNLPDETLIFYGEEEGSKYPSLKKTCEDASQLSGSKLISVNNAPHSIKFPEYQRAIKSYLK